MTDLVSRLPLRKLSWGAAVVLVSLYAFVAFRGPRGIPALLEKRAEIQALQEQNANLAREIELRRERIRRLNEDREEQGLEIRRRLKLQQKGDTTVMLPDAPAGQ